VSIETNRLLFLEQRDGKEGALAFAIATCSTYRIAVLQNKKRKVHKVHFASLPDYRKGFIESYVAFKRYINTGIC
jgi:hypothetical protein